MATMRDVAAVAGVSLKTVSRVVNGEPGVRPETAARVHHAVGALRFQPNTMARSLRAGRALPLLGLVIGDLANPFYSGIARGVEEVAADHGYLVISGSSQEHTGREQDLIATLYRQHVAGLLVVPAQAEGPHAAMEREGHTPTVFLDRPAAGRQADTVLLDNRGGARQAIEYLIALGHQRIGVVGDGRSFYTAEERVAGYHDAIATAGLASSGSLVALGAHDVAQAEAGTDRLLGSPNPPTAIFALNNRATVGVLRSTAKHRASIGVLGFDDLELGDMLPWLVALVVHDPIEMGRVAARILFGRLAGDRGPVRRLVLPATLACYDRSPLALYPGLAR